MPFIVHQWLLNHCPPLSEAALDVTPVKPTVTVGNKGDVAIHPDLADYWSSYYKRPLSELMYLPTVDFPIFPSIEIGEGRP